MGQAAAGNKQQAVGAQGYVVPGHQLAQLGFAQGGLGVEQIDHLVQTLLETVLTDPQRLRRRLEGIGGGGEADPRGAKLVPRLLNLELNALLEPLDVGRSRGGLVASGFTSRGFGSAVEEVQSGEGRDRPGVAVAAEDGVVVEVVPRAGGDLGQVPGLGRLLLELSGLELLAGCA